MTVYRVGKRRSYRGHQPGSVFEDRLDQNAERRALLRGDIEVVDRSTPQLQPGSYRLPRGWHTTTGEVQ